MHFQNSPLVLLAFTTLSSAEQFPFADKLQGWLNQAQSVAQQYIPNSVPNPLHAGAAKVAENQVSQLTLQNWRSVLVPAGPSSGPFEPWMVYFTGGNRTCYGNCGQVDAKWNESAAVLAALPNAPHLAELDCENNNVLCNSWMADVPSIWYILLPKPLPDQSRPSTDIYIRRLNRTSTTVRDIVSLHTEGKYKTATKSDSAFHPFDGYLHKYGVAVPIGYVLLFFTRVPSWAIMIGISFFSRTFMTRRMTGGGIPPAPAAGPGGQRAEIGG